jgi:hypothetical protein
MVVCGKPLGCATIELAFPTTLPAYHMASVCGQSLIACLKSEDMKVKLRAIDFELQVQSDLEINNLKDKCPNELMVISSNKVVLKCLGDTDIEEISYKAPAKE